MTKTIFFTSDQHFGRRNIIRLCNRPFSSVEEMDEKMIARWNAKVMEQDTVYILGDFLFRCEKPPEEYLERLKGRKHLLVGNHDKAWHKRCDASQWFESVDELLFLSDGQRRLALCHYPGLEQDALCFTDTFTTTRAQPTGHCSKTMLPC